jgi:hypothetical protein
MTDAELQAIEARLKAITPGVWRFDGSDVVALDGLWPAAVRHLASLRAGANGMNNGAFIVFAPADVAALLAEVRFLRRVLCDMADDGKDVEAVTRYRRALEEVARVGADNGRFCYDGAAGVLEDVARAALEGTP